MVISETTEKMMAMMATSVVALSSVHYLTCRHGYEATLVAELSRSGLVASSPCTALARLETDAHLPAPTYALQILPHAIEVRGPSIKALADGAASAINDGAIAALLKAAPRGALQTHVLVPDCLRGVPPSKAKLMNRCESIGTPNHRIQTPVFTPRHASDRPAFDLS